jgi:rare lipoprotein A
LNDPYRFVLTWLTALALAVPLGLAAVAPPPAEGVVATPVRVATPVQVAATPSDTIPSRPADTTAAVDTVAMDAEAPEETEPAGEVEVGEATWYGEQFHGRLTASGEPFDQEALLAAHLTHPFGTVLRVTNQQNGRSVLVRVVDRGPNAPGKEMPAIVDVSRAAARELDMIDEGRVIVSVEVVPPPEE